VERQQQSGNERELDLVDLVVRHLDVFAHGGDLRRRHDLHVRCDGDRQGHFASAGAVEPGANRFAACH